MQFLADEDFDNDIIRGLLRRLPKLDIVRVQDVGLSGQQDGVVIAWAAETGRILLTHDVNTMLTQAYARVSAGLRMPGVFAVSHSIPIGLVIEHLALVAEYSLPAEWEGQVRFLPLQ